MKAKSTIASQIWPKSKYPNLLEVDVLSLTFLGRLNYLWMIFSPLMTRARWLKVPSFFPCGVHY